MLTTPDQTWGKTDMTIDYQDEGMPKQGRGLCVFARPSSAGQAHTWVRDGADSMIEVNDSLVRAHLATFTSQSQLEAQTMAE